ncbi:hypothetical protein D043_2330B, partial [Vibrio parahaemolyticus EKP-021]
FTATSYVTFHSQIRYILLKN